MTNQEIRTLRALLESMMASAAAIDAILEQYDPADEEPDDPPRRPRYMGDTDTPN
jgi:hypothetical protein